LTWTRCVVWIGGAVRVPAAAGGAGLPVRPRAVPQPAPLSPADLLLLDLNMPAVDGHSVMRDQAKRGIAADPRVGPVACRTRRSSRHALPFEAERLLVKPVTREAWQTFHGSSQLDPEVDMPDAFATRRGHAARAARGCRPHHIVIA